MNRIDGSRRLRVPFSLLLPDRSTRMAFELVPAGCFQMGNTAGHRPGRDTEPVRDGHRERLVGRLTKERSETIYVATKIPPKNGQWPAQSGVSVAETFPAEHLIACTEESLKISAWNGASETSSRILVAEGNGFAAVSP